MGSLSFLRRKTSLNMSFDSSFSFSLMNTIINSGRRIYGGISTRSEIGGDRKVFFFIVCLIFYMIGCRLY